MEKTMQRASFVVYDDTLDLVDDYAERHDLNRSQCIRRALRLLVTIEDERKPGNGPQIRTRAPIPKAHRNGSGGP
jgi:metal-responsive CopG/Arc/MetJ family transcriptional regulator